MYLYNLTLQRSTVIYQSVHGNFSGTKQQEIAISRGKILDLLKPDPTTGKVYTQCSTEVFGVIRSMMAFRLTGGVKDYLVVGSDSGRISVLEYNSSKNCFEKVHMETYGKSGVRRIVPGQYLAMDPKGRAVMIAAVEKQKLVYIFNRDAQARLTISSPLEAHKSNTIIHHICGVDVGYENPLFACLEVDYEEADLDATGAALSNTKQLLTFYELDLGLNHVVRKYSEPLEVKANMLLPVPGGNDGPSGVLICAENYLVYKNLGDQPDIKCPIPRRKYDLDDSERSMLFVCSASHKTKSLFFILLQTEQGDIFKVTLQVDGDMVSEIRMKYFDTVPVAASMNVLKTGFLFVAAEFGNHYLYQIAKLGDDDGEPEFSSSIPLDEGETFFFGPRPLKNLSQVDELDSLCPIVQCQTFDLANEDTPQLYTICGRGPKSSMKVLRHGLEVSEMAVSELPGNPNAVWTVKKRADDVFDAYIIVSFVNATLVLSIGETVEEVTDSGFLGTTPTKSCSQLGDDALVQIYPKGIRHIRADRRVNEWRTPERRNVLIEHCAVNHRQVVIALTGGELVYFEMGMNGQLNEYTERKQMPKDVICMGIGRVSSGEQRFRFLAVGLKDNTVRIISLDYQDCLTPLSTQALPAPPDSLCIIEMGGSEDADNASGGLFLFIGLQNGVLLRTKLDAVTGDLSDTRTRYLGTRPVKLFPISVQGRDSILAVSSRSWLCYWYQNRFHLTPLSYEALDYSSGFASEQCPEGIVAICSNTLRILALEKLGVQFNQVSYPLPFTPKKFIIHPASGNLIIVCSDHNAFTNDVKRQRKHQLAEDMVSTAGENEQQMAAELANQFLAEDLPEDVFNPPKAGTGWWAACIVILNAQTGTVLQRIDFEQNEAAMSLALVRFSVAPDSTFILVGTVKDLILSPRQCMGGFIHTYRLVDNGCRLEEMHITPVEEAPMAICAYQGKCLIGVGKLLRLYELGRKKLLRKSENRKVPNMVVGLWPSGRRCFVGDVQESISVVSYKHIDNQLNIFADDTTCRWMTCATLLDHDTIAGADKFGNVFILRLPGGVSDDVEDDPSGAKALWEKSYLNGASQKAESIATFHIGDVVTSLQRTTLIPGGSESLIYTTLSGQIGMLVPFSSKDEYEFFQHLEMHVRQEMHTICGRDHLSYRSYYYPAKSVVDGDLCELYSSLDFEKQKTIAGELEKNPNQVSKRLEDIRTRFGF